MATEVHQAVIGNTLADSKPYWPSHPGRPQVNGRAAPNILVILFDDVGFSDFGCYGSPIVTPHINAIAARGLRMSGFHTTAMCSTTRAALLTGRNHHAVGMGCLANFDSGFPGYRGKLAKEAGTLAEMLRPHGWRNTLAGKWHVTPLTQTGPTGPYDGWPLGRGFDRFYGFMDAETDQYAPELVRDNTHVSPPGTHASGYHLTADLVDESIRYLADHLADAPDAPWMHWLALGACHAPHQAPADLIAKYDAVFARGWDVERAERLARQQAMGLVPANTSLPGRNEGVRPWATCSPDEQRLFTRLQAAYAAMLEHADQHIGRLMAFLESSDQLDNTLVLVLSDNGASQEGGPLGMVNAMGPYNLKPEDLAEKLRRIDDIGGPDTHSNFPLGWAMASNTPLKRYKQNTHGGGVRDPLVLSWPAGLPGRGEILHGFWHARDLVPSLLDLCGVAPPDMVNGVPQLPVTGESFKAACLNMAAAANRVDGASVSRQGPQLFEMFGHRGIWHQGWKAVAFHPLGTPFDADVWELYHLDQDFAENQDLAAQEPERLARLQALWWAEAQANQVLPLDDRFGPRFAENARRHQGAGRTFTFHAGMGHLPTDVAPDVRARDYVIEAEVLVPTGDCQGVLLAHGDATSGYSLYVEDGHLVHDLNVGGLHQVLKSTVRIPPGRRRLAFAMTVGPIILSPPLPRLGRVPVPTSREGLLRIDGVEVGRMRFTHGFQSMISWSGLDIGLDRGSPVSHYEAPFRFNGRLVQVQVVLQPQRGLDAEASARAELARQ
jgi:arylsulfatase A-like enzyme